MYFASSVPRPNPSRRRLCLHGCVSALRSWRPVQRASATSAATVPLPAASLADSSAEVGRKLTLAEKE
jgi:hypothetical protein